MTERQRADGQLAVNTYAPTTYDQPADAPVLVEIHVTEGFSGSFLLQDAGTVSGSLVTGKWFVVPNSASGELTGLRGEGGFEVELGQNARWTLEYWFE
jgi:hypothetical protein